MVKKLKYLLLILPFFITLNVKAISLIQPTVYVHTDNGDLISSNVSSGVWWDVPVWSGPSIGYFTSAAPRITQVDYNFIGTQYCLGKEISISGKIGVLYDFFDEQSYDITILNNGEPLICSYQKENSSRLAFTCYGHGGGNFIIYIKENSFSSSNYITGIVKDVAISCDVSNQAIVEQSIINSQNIINNNNSNTNQIIQNNEQNTQDIIDNQNENTDREIESQQVCKQYDKNNIYTDNSFLRASGTVYSQPSFGITDYISILNSTIKVLNIYTSSSSTDANLCFYNVNKSIISCISNTTLTSNSYLTIPPDASFVRFVIRKSDNRPIFEVCTNGNQALNDSLNGLNDTLNDTSQPNTNQDFNDMNNMVASSTPISDLITMPLTLINAYINGVNSSCSPINLGNLYGTDLILPCINLEQRLGSNLWNIIDAFFSIFMCYNIGMLFITAFDGITSLRDDFEGLYQPRHADTGYTPKHGG